MGRILWGTGSPEPPETPEVGIALAVTLSNTATLLWRNRWSDTVLGSISSPEAFSTFPASNTQAPQLSRVWRAEAPNAYIHRDLGAAYRIGAVAICGHNFSNSGCFRFRASNNSNMSSPLHDTGATFIDIWEELFDANTFFGDADGYPTAEGKQILPRPVRLYEFDEVTARYLQFDFSDGGSMDGVLDVGYVYAGPRKVWTDQVSMDWQLTPVETNRVDRAYNGQAWVDALAKYYEVRGLLYANSSAEAHWWVFFYNLVGSAQPFPIRVRNEHLLWRGWTTMLVRFLTVPRVRHIEADLYEIAVELREWV